MIQYLLTVSICWIALYTVYHLFLRRETFFSINRGYLMTSLIAGLLIPAYQWIPSSVYTQAETISYIYDLSETVVLMSPVQETSVWSWSLALSSFYLLGALVMGAKLLHGLRRIAQLRHDAEVDYIDDVKVYNTNKLHLPFSFWQSIYLSKELPLKEEVMSVLQHEKVHIKEWHSVDILLIELMHVFFWFNPILIFYKKAIQQSHEYVADATVIQDIPRKSYGQLLLKQSQSGLEIALANHFFHSQIKKRITMMYQEKSKRPAMVKYLAAIPVLALLLIIFSSNTQINNPPFEKEANTILDQRAELGDAKTAIQLAQVFEKYLRKSDSKESMIEEIEKFTKENGMSINLGEEVVTGLFFDKPLGYLEEIVVVGHGKGLKDKRTDKRDGPIALTFDGGSFIPGKKLVASKLPSVNQVVLDNVYNSEKGLLVIDGKKVDKNKKAWLDKNIHADAMNILDPKTGLERYGEEGKFGVIELIGYKEVELRATDKGEFPSTEGVKMGQNSPNPWAASTIIPVHSDKETDATLTLYDRWGSVAYEKELRLKEGKNELTIEKAFLEDGPGIYLYQLRGEGFNLKNKMQLNKSIGNDGLDNSKEVFKVVEHMPTFPGCEGDKLSAEYKKCSDQKMLEYIYTNLRYPKEARKNGVEGMVVVQFIVDTDGSVDEVAVVRDPGMGLGDEAKRVVESFNDMPEPWTPGMQRGKKVKVQYTLPVRYKLQGDDTNEPKLDLPKDALVLIDGIESEKGIGDLSPDDIETIHVLKGEAAQKQYGDKAKNGAVLIETKKIVLKGEPLFILDGKEINKEVDEAISPDDIAKIEVLKDEKAVEAYGEKGRNGVIVITSKEQNKKLEDGAKSLFGVADKVELGDEIFKVVEQMPRFPGCEEGEMTKEERTKCSQQKLLNYLYSNIKYPKKAAKEGVEGVSVVEFVVRKDGSLSDFKILRNPGAGTGEEAQRVIISMNDMDEKWIPGMQRGKLVNVRYVLPIKFMLEGGSQEADEAVQPSLRNENTLALTDFKVAPNPTKNRFRLTFNGQPGPIEISVSDISGRVLYMERFNSFDGSFDQEISSDQFSNTMGILMIKQADQIFTEKIVFTK